ncbi:MAG: M23 family metallopeptidase [Rhodoferax sp.]|uniref:M23 family metallopeptidase n=1 Tax=Rhodoferax sp. TaxID=50421 RepID=UPI00261B4BD8|nr:M23 family metallopeptidase [Rhodoferax sp.]MDD2879555.1 M23 family metallopeptidase [Rhodoferax sp.]
MQLIITDAWLAKSRALHLSGLQLFTAFLLSALVLMLLALGLYHWVFLKGAREGWPVVGALVKLVVKDEAEQRDRYLRENLDVMARRLGEMQAKVTQLESLGERVSSLAGVNPAAVKVSPGQGGVEIKGHALTLDELQVTMDDLERLTHQRTDLLTVLESRLFDRKMKNLMVPTEKPVAMAELGSAFGWRTDPITGRNALHTGLDFPAATSTPILAAAGGVVVTQEFHPEYGNMIEIDHGNDLVTRYAHASRIWVKKGDLIKRGQKIAEVGTSGRSTGPHLHFEVLVQGIPQDPQKFLLASERAQGLQIAAAGRSPAAQGQAGRKTAAQ